MSTKHPLFPNGHEDADDSRNQTESDAPDAASGSEVPQRRAAKGRAAYAAQDTEIPAYGPRGPSFGPIGGLYADDAAAPVGHGVQAKSGEQFLAEVAKEALFAECQTRICPECPLKKEADETRLRSLADLDNARKRLSREREEQVRFASEAVLTDIVPSLDNLDLALQHAGGHEACRDFIVGVQMTRKLLLDALEKHGLQSVGQVGEAFDPAIHEAVGMTDAPDVPDNHICALLSNGYTLKDRLLRPARVMVCKKA